MSKFYYVLFFFLTSFISSTAFSQGTTCGAAPALPVNTTCVNQAFLNDENGTSPEFVASCATGGTSYADVWYTVTGTGNPMTVTVSGTDRDYALAALTSCVGGELDCTQQASGATGSVTFATTLGTTYYIHIQRRSGNNNADLTGNICAVSAGGAGSCAADLTVSSTLYSNTGLTTCGAGDDYSSADACGSSYLNGDDYVIEYTPTTSECVQFSLTNTGTWVGIFLTDDCMDAGGATCLTNGTSSGGNPSMNYSVTAGTTYYITISTFPAPQCTAFDIDISACPPAPANDDCGAATPLTVNPDNLCGTTTAGTIQNATTSAQANGCGGTADDDVWYSFVATSTVHDISLLNVSGSTTDLYHSVYSGTCGSLGAALVCSDPNLSTIGGLTIGNTYYVRVYSWTSTTGQTTTFDVCIGTPPPPPANDECSGAVALTVNPDNLCGSTTAGTIQSASTSAQANGCGGTANDDVWYSFVATSTAHDISLLNVSGSTTDLYHSVYSGTCGSLGAALVCSDPNISSIGGLTIGNTYYVRVYSWTSTTGQTSTFDICIGTPPPPPANDECSGAITVPVSASGCTPTTGSVYSATTSPQANGCFGTANDDVWYSFTATTTDVQIDLTNISGSTTDLYHSVYAGTCGALGAELVCSDPNSSQVNSLTVGNVYFIRVYSYTSTAGQTTSFDLCVSEIGPCGVTSATEDYCPYAAVLTQGPGSWSSSTYPYYTQDLPGNINSVFCGSIENNSWYEFVATSTSAVFDFTSVGNCTGSNWGVQAEVYDVTYDASGCCTNFNSVSNCYNPGTATPGTVTATGLTIGNTYILMVDGWGGDNCDFTVSNWTATGILLPVELTDFRAIGMERENVISWVTASEHNNDYFGVMRSFDGVNFEEIGKVEGAGNSTSTNMYQFIDDEVRTGIVYYQLGQYDINGQLNSSKVIALNRSENANGILAAWPNPTDDVLYVEINPSASDVTPTLQLLDSRGLTIENRALKSGELNTIDFSLAELSAGVYIILYTDHEGITYTQKILKK